MSGAHLEAQLTDLRHDRHVRGVVLNARDITDRVRLESELMRQNQRDRFGTQLVEALEMADEEPRDVRGRRARDGRDVPTTPMELLLSDSSRAHLASRNEPDRRRAGCPVRVAFLVRRGPPRQPRRLRVERAPERVPQAARAARRRLLRRVRAGLLHGPLARRPPHDGADGEPRAPSGSRAATLAAQAGARIGTVRAFQKTQLQASTDALTGLINRRTLEEQMR